MSKRLVDIFKALADETRVDIVKTLLEYKELSCQELSKKFPLSQPTLSHHFNKLIDAGVIKVRKNGVSHYYKIHTSFLRSIGINITKIIHAKEAYI